MFNFFKRNKKYPSFEALKQYDKQYGYFIRTAQWDWLDKENIFVIDRSNPRVLTLDPWHQIIFIAADGQRTVTDYILYVAEKYTGEIPGMLDATIINELNTLQEYGIITFVETKQRPELKYDLPTNRKDNDS